MKHCGKRKQRIQLSQKLSFISQQVLIDQQEKGKRIRRMNTKKVSIIQENFQS